MELELVKINPEEYGLTSQTAQDISNQFKPMLDKMVELESEYNEVVQLPIEDKETTKKARDLRLKYVKVRTATADIHKQQKDFYLKGGRFVDGWKNAQLMASQGKEERLKEIEDYFENLERERIAKLNSERIEAIRPFVEDVAGLDFGTMQKDVWEAYFEAKQKAYNEKVEAEKKAEEERISREKAEVEERERIRIENERLRKEAEAREAEIKAEREAKAKLEAELLAKKQAEEKAEAERLAKIEAERKEAEKLAKAPIKKQLQNWVSGFEIVSAPVENEVSNEILAKFAAFKVWASKEIEKL